MMAVLLAVRWWRRRSAITSGNLDALAPDKVDADLRRYTPVPAAGPTADKPTWQSPNSGWGWLIGKIFGITFASRLAYRCANLSALGFLGFMPLPGWHGCFGFFGLFGLIGVAHVIEAFARPNLTTGKMVAMVTVLGMAIAMFVSFFLAYLSVPPSSPATTPTTTNATPEK